MLKRLQNKWKVSAGRLLLILATFACGGSLCGYAGRKLLALMPIEKGVLWVIIYVILITILWPLCVILISIPFGQFNFFRAYLKKIFSRMSGRKKRVNTRILIFASGTGSNAARLIEYFKDGERGIEIAAIVSNNAAAGVLEVARSANIPAEVIGLKGSLEPNLSDTYLSLADKYRADFLILAGFLKKVPPAVINRFKDRIINIHPALLPAYGGEGMFGAKVHEAVISAGEKQSGITIHFADEIYDNGKIIFQGYTAIDEGETSASLAKKIQALEHEHFPRVVEEVINAR